MVLKSVMIKKTHKIINHAIFQIGELLYPPVCASCNCRILRTDDTLCPLCWKQLRDSILSPACPTCGKSTSQYEIFNGKCHNCQDSDSELDFLLRVGNYQGALKNLILSLKYHHQSRLDQFLGKLAADAALARPETRNINYLVPIPLHWRRKLNRGYNQSEILAVQIARNLNNAGIKNISVSNELVRIRNTPPQTILPAGKRKKNLVGAFSIRPDAPYKNKNICLVDDVTTTGTTLNTAAKELKRFGARSVSAMVIIVPDGKII